MLEYPEPKAASHATHLYLRNVEKRVRRGQAVLRLCLELAANGFEPEVICCHPGWGEGLYLREAFPQSRLLFFCEFFHRPTGANIGFDPEFPSNIDDRCRIRTRNSVNLLSLEAADWGVTPTYWQWSTHPPEFRQKISVIFDGVDTGRVAPNASARFELPNGKRLQFGDEILTFISRNLEPYRGFHTFLRALPAVQRRRPDLQTVVGGGDKVSYGSKPKDFDNWREALLAEVGDELALDRVHFVGRLARISHLDVGTSGWRALSP